jgi:hypothetical protein
MATTLYVLNPDNTLHWENYQLYLRVIKERFANTFSCKTNKRLHGNHYGFVLPKPYTVADVDAVCVTKQIALPVALFTYLTKVSKEMFITGYPFIFDLQGLPSKAAAKNIFIPYDRRYSLTQDDFNYPGEDDDDGDANDDDEDLSKNKKFAVEAFANCMCRVADQGGAVHDSIYLGSGPLYGSVWTCNGNTDWTKKTDSFDAYIRLKFCKV